MGTQCFPIHGNTALQAVAFFPFSYVVVLSIPYSPSSHIFFHSPGASPSILFLPNGNFEAYFFFFLLLQLGSFLIVRDRRSTPFILLSGFEARCRLTFPPGRSPVLLFRPGQPLRFRRCRTLGKKTFSLHTQLFRPFHLRNLRRVSSPNRFDTVHSMKFCFSVCVCFPPLPSIFLLPTEAAWLPSSVDSFSWLD